MAVACHAVLKRSYYPFGVFPSFSVHVNGLQRVKSQASEYSGGFNYFNICGTTKVAGTKLLTHLDHSVLHEAYLLNTPRIKDKRGPTIKLFLTRWKLSRIYQRHSASSPVWLHPRACHLSAMLVPPQLKHGSLSLPSQLMWRNQTL